MKKLDWTNHFIEFITVVVGILLAFGLNAFYENRKEANAVAKQLEGIKQEIKVNLEEIEQKLKYHGGLLDSLRINPRKVVLRLKSPNLENAAWLIAQNVSFKESIDYDLYKHLISIYQTQEKLNKHCENSEELMSYLNIVGPYHQLELFSSGIDKQLKRDEVISFLRKGWVYIFEDTVSWESELKEKYQKVLKQL